MNSRVITAILGAAIGALIMLVSSQLSGEDRGSQIASHLRLGNGIVLGSILGALVSLWLSLGGRKRMAGISAWMIAIAAGAGLWALGSPVVWVLEVVLTGIFGEGAAGLAPFVGIGLLIAIVRAIAGYSSAILKPWLDQLLSGGEAGLGMRSVGDPNPPER
jgi:hypothetical protein